MNLEEIRKRVMKILEDAEGYEDTADGDVFVFEKHQATEKIIELLVEIRPTLRAVENTIAPDEKCFSCKDGENMPVEYIAKQYGYKLCKFHADMGLVAGWDIEKISVSTKV